MIVEQTDTIVIDDSIQPEFDPKHIPIPEELDECEEVWKNLEKSVTEMRLAAGLTVDDAFLQNIRKSVKEQLERINKRRIELGYLTVVV